MSTQNLFPVFEKKIDIIKGSNYMDFTTKIDVDPNPSNVSISSDASLPAPC